MFSDVDQETSYRIVLRFLKGIAPKFVDNYHLPDNSQYYRWLSRHRISHKKILSLKKTIAKIHKYLNSLGSGKKPPRYSTLSKYLQLCRINKASLCLDTNCLHFITSLWYLFHCYEQILAKMVSGDALNVICPSYPEIFTQISKNLIAAVIHHEVFLQNPSFADQLGNAKKTFDILLR